MTAPFAIKNRFADRGAVAEKAAQKFLTDWAQHPGREFQRMVDSKAAGRIIKAAAADFEFYCRVGSEERPCFGLIEVKETRHAFRLERKRITQMARLRKRANCGGICLVLIYHSTENLWRCLNITTLLADNGEGAGSWDLSKVPTFNSVEHALQHAVRGPW